MKVEIIKKMNIAHILKKHCHSGRYAIYKRKKITQMPIVVELLKSQWDKSIAETVDAQVGDRIWRKIASRCYPTKIQRTSGKILALYAASVVAAILVCTVWLTLQNNSEVQTEYETITAQNHSVYTLPDNSKIWMQPGSSIRYLKGFDQNRNVILKGDATFEVVKHDGHPFRVYIKGAFIEVKGTTFRVVNKEQGESKTILFGGHINFHYGIKGEMVAMNPRQQITYSDDGTVKVENISDINWMNGKYKFTDTRLDSLIDIINTMYDKKIKLESNVPAHYLFSGIIRYDERLSEVAEKICYNMHLRYKWENEKIIIYKRENH